jgi:3-dehydroquinate synthase
MMILSALKTYSVDFIESLDEVFDLQQRTDTCFLIDKKVYDLYERGMPNFNETQLSLIEAVEQHKTIDSVLAICEKITAFNTKRNTILIAIGGGIVQDISGFVANILYRGIQWFYFPTTLLAACDSCIGGKSSLNYKTYKNLLGSFYPPDKIMIYSKFFETLSLKDYYSGLGEVVKFNVLAGRMGMKSITSGLEGLLARDTDVLHGFIENSLKFKKDFIEEDEFDKGKRIFLNFAHTFGHAFETASGYIIPHGSAVVLGMITANFISLRRGILAQDIVEEIELVCKKIICLDLKKEWFEKDAIITAIKKDKKQTDNFISAILLHDDFSLRLHRDIGVDEINQAVFYMLQVFIPPPNTHTYSISCLTSC